MRNTFMVILALILLSICLLSGGCAQPDQSKIKDWQDLLKIPAQEEKAAPGDKTPRPQKNKNSLKADGKKLQISLYFGDARSQKLVAEERDIAKVEGIARETMEELLKGPANVEAVQLFPDGTRLLDINVKPDGLCVVDLSSEVRGVNSREQEKLMIYAVANTLGQFPTIKSISFMVDGKNATSIGGYMNLDNPIEPNYSI
ncbi:GerMN domain [Syntrophomonas zehnderi OL-4]|uniref:GerMN domain n=1 Tax=Syntrophomonas zehnderi OL-4 TaxID=690567 RepID=A0A0E4C7Z8_9FIRM|nr:GerMN domain-containing protein [Syntrophomonas zehnderi]CFX18794.1 GerMN domain [Syntrophomonas zehnderi OL-4]